MNDIYGDTAQSLVAPASGAYQVAPNDSTDLPQVSRAIYVGTGGTLVVEMLWGSTITFANVAAGTLLPIRARKVMAASTAAAIVGLY